MKRNYIFFLVCTLVCAIIVINPLTYLNSFSPAPPEGKTGSIGDAGATCTGCHGGSPIPISGWVTSNIPIAGYAPGTNYTINVTAMHSTAQEIGFEATAENTAGSSVGSLVVTDPTRTGIIGSNYIGHILAGVTPIAAGVNAWSFDWIAPASGTGEVIFYAAVNAANGNNAVGGDTIYTSSLTVQEDTAAPIGVRDYGLNKQVMIYPNPASVYISVDLGDGWQDYSDILIYDLTGAIVLRKTSIPGKIVKVDIESLKSGTYFVSLVNNDGKRTGKKLVIK